MTSFTNITCYRCKEVFGMGAETYHTLKRSHATFHCPFGHPQHFPEGETEEAKLRRERDQLTQRVAEWQDYERQASKRADAAERRASAARGQVTRLKNRAANGVCPCCSRSFADLRRHMASKHAGFLAEDVQAEVGKIIN